MAHIPRQRRPYVDACEDCPEMPHLTPMLVSPDGRGGVVADYLCPAGHMWFTGWQRDPDHERWAA